VLYHLLAVKPSPSDLSAVQQALVQEANDIPLRRAVVAPDAQIAFRAAMALGLSAQVFGGMEAAVKWLEQN
jgi:hypothetical protein